MRQRLTSKPGIEPEETLPNQPQVETGATGHAVVALSARRREQQAGVAGPDRRSGLECHSPFPHAHRVGDGVGLCLPRGDRRRRRRAIRAHDRPGAAFSRSQQPRDIVVVPCRRRACIFVVASPAPPLGASDLVGDVPRYCRGRVRLATTTSLSWRPSQEGPASSTRRRRRWAAR